jgi:hypothetical protein
MVRLSCFLLFALLAMARGGMVRGRPAIGAVVQAAQQEWQTVGEKDQAAHDKAGCFCQTNLAEKQQTVESLQSQLTGLSHDIDEQNAKISQLDVEVKQHSEELDSSSGALATAEALRKKDNEKFVDDEQSHTQSIDSLQSAIDAIKNPHSSGDSFIAIREVAKRAKDGQVAFVQLQHRLKTMGSSNPAEITGVMEHMLNSFSTNLQSMRDEEVEAKKRHEDLAAAKRSEISSQKKHVMEKTQRLAKTKVSENFKEQIQARSQKVLDANVQLLNELKQICQSNDESFEARHEIQGNLITTLAGAQVDIAGAQLLSVSGTSRGDGIGDLCLIAAGLQEEDWRSQAKKACEKAKAGAKQDAADAIEALEADIRQAQNEVSRKQDDCTEEIRSAQTEAGVAAREESAEADYVGSSQKDAEDQIAALQAQADGAEKAKAVYEQVTATRKEAFQAMRVATSHLKQASDRASGSAASGKIGEALAEAEKLMAAADGYDGDSDKASQELAGLLRAVQTVAGKAMIPLRLMKADSEEAAISIKEDHESRAHARRPTCDANKLASEVARFKGYRDELGKAAESLAWASLR